MSTNADVRWLSAREVSELTGFSEQVVRRWARAGMVQARMSPGQGTWRIAVDGTGWPLAGEAAGQN